MDYCFQRGVNLCNISLNLGDERAQSGWISAYLGKGDVHHGAESNVRLPSVAEHTELPAHSIFSINVLMSVIIAMSWKFLGMMFL